MIIRNFSPQDFEIQKLTTRPKEKAERAKKFEKGLDIVRIKLQVIYRFK